MLEPSSKFAIDRAVVTPQLPAALDADYLAFERHLVDRRFRLYTDPQWVAKGNRLIKGYMLSFEAGVKWGRKHPEK